MSLTESTTDSSDTMTAHPDAIAKPGYDPEIALRVRKEREAHRNARRQTKIDFVPRLSTAVIDVEIELHAAIVQKNFSLWYSTAQSSTFMLQEVLETMTTRDNHQQALVIVDEMIAPVRKDLEGTLERLKMLADAVGFRQKRKFTNPKKLVVPAYTPVSMDFLHLIRIYDEILWYLEAMQILREVPNHEKVAERANIRGKLNALSRDIARIWIRAKAAANREAKAAQARYEARINEKELAAITASVSDVEGETVQNADVDDSTADVEALAAAA